MTRLVRGADGRMWTVRSQLIWRNSSMQNDFEFDISGSKLSGIFVFAIVIILGILVFAWQPEVVVIPNWLIVALILLILFFPARWLARRPWLITAESRADLDLQPERWASEVRGFFVARNEVAHITRKIEMFSTPADSESGLELIE